MISEDTSGLNNRKNSFSCFKAEKKLRNFKKVLWEGWDRGSVGASSNFSIATVSTFGGKKNSSKQKSFYTVKCKENV